MGNILKSAKLDFALLKPYIKSICFILLVPIFVTLTSRSLISGVAFAMCVMSMSTNYTFAVSEKNGMERLYGILPVEKAHLVLGKYLCVYIMGLLALLVSLVVHPLVLTAFSMVVSPLDILIAGIVGIVTFMLYTAFQIPGYYKYGSIKGRIFLYIPIIGYLLITLIVNKTMLIETISPVHIAAIAVLSLFISMLFSVKILKRKEL